MEDVTSEGTTHDLLLALAGRVDDDLLGWARELVALGEDARAVEMLTASLVAARAVLPAPVRSAVVAAAHGARTDLGPAAALPPPHREDGTEHRFTVPDGDDPVAGALLDLPARPLTGCSVLLARRLTPAGAAPGPLPHPVVLVRVHDGSRPVDVLAYQLGAALDRAGAPASVEVLPADGSVPHYHAAALNSAVELRGGDADDRPWRPAPVPQADRDEDRTVEKAVLAPPHPLAGRDPEPAPEPAAADTPIRRTPEPAPRIPDPGPDLDAPARRDPEPSLFEDPTEATGRQPADRRRPEPEPEPEPGEAEAATVVLSVEPEYAYSLDDDHRDDHQGTYQDEDDVQDSDEDDDLRDGDFRDGDFRDGDYRDGDYRDDPADAREPTEEAFGEPPSPHPLAAPRPLPARDESRPARPIPLPAAPPAARPRPTVTPISRPAVPNPIPLRRGGPTPIPRPQPVGEQRPALRRVDDRDDYNRDELEPPAPERAERPGADLFAPHPQEPRPARGESPAFESPAFESLSDPLNGPLHQPLLAPLLDPTGPEDDPLGLAGRRPRPEKPQDDEWSEEWISGTWAMAPSALDDRADARPKPEPDTVPADDVEPGRPAPRPAPRHRYLIEPAAADEPRGSEHDRAIDGGAGDEPAEPHNREGDPERPDLGLRPESIARLSDADRQLLARLQAELLEGRRQRIGRRIVNGSGATTNGTHPGPPPDLVS